MKKILFGFSFFIILVWPRATWAQTTAVEQINLQGKVYLENGLNPIGESVEAVCVRTNGSKHFLGYSMIHRDGSYYFHTTTTDCPLGSTMQVRTQQYSNAHPTGSTNAVVTHNMTLDVRYGQNIGPVVAVPEYTWLSGGLVMIGSVSGLILARRRQLSP